MDAKQRAEALVSQMALAAKAVKRNPHLLDMMQRTAKRDNRLEERRRARKARQEKPTWP